MPRMLALWMLLLLALPALTKGTLGPLPAPAMAQDELGMLRLPGGTVERVQVPGGPTVLLQPVPELPAAAVCLWIPAGARLDPPGRAGLAHLAEHLLQRATPAYPGGRLPVLLEEVGARSGAMTTDEGMLFWCVVPSRHLDLALSIQADRLSPAEFTPGDVEREKQLVCAELTLESPAQRQAGAVRLALWPDRAGPVGGHAPTVRTLGPGDIKRFHSQHSGRPQAVLAVVGGFNRPKVRQRLWKLFPPGASPPNPSVASSPVGAGTRRAPSERGGAVAVFSLEGLGPADFPALKVLEQALETPTVWDPPSGTAQIWFPDLSSARKRLSSLREVGLSEAELTRARDRSRTRLLRDWEDLAGRSCELVRWEAAGRLDW
ncbi:MAG: insulinase family protein, partial [Candidatus Eremiobacterota bacterium]